MKKYYFVLALSLVFIVANLSFAQTVVNVTPNVPDALFNALGSAAAGDILQLSDGGIYPNSASLEVTQAITIRTAPGYKQKAMCVFMPNTTGAYPTNMMNVGASILLKDVIFNMERGTVAAWGGRFINRSSAGIVGGVIKVFNCEVYRPGSMSEGGAFDSLIVRDSYISGHLKNKGGWAAPFSVGKSLAKYVEFTNNTLVFCEFAPVLVDGWGNYLTTGIGKVILDHNTMYCIDGAHGPATMISRTKDVIVTNNLYYNPTFRPNETYSDKAIDFPQNDDVVGDNIKVISELGPKGLWVFSLEMGDTAQTDLTMEANNFNWDPQILKAWSDRGLQPVHLTTNETKKFIKDFNKAIFSEDLAFTNAPALPMDQINLIADTTKKHSDDPVKYRGKTPFSGVLYYNTADLMPLYDWRTKDQVDMSYPSTAKSYTAGVYTDKMKEIGLKGAAGYPLGDLNWFPALKANWEKGNAVGVKTNESIPAAYELSQNFPNPFNPTTTIFYSLKKTADVNLTIFNILGQPVKTLVKGKMNAGSHTEQWDGTNEIGAKVVSGIYYYRLVTENQSQTMKMVLMK